MLAHHAILSRAAKSITARSFTCDELQNRLPTLVDQMWENRATSEDNKHHPSVFNCLSICEYSFDLACPCVFTSVGTLRYEIYVLVVVICIILVISYYCCHTNCWIIYLPCSVVRRGRLLPSRLDSSPKLAVVRPELKLPRNVCILSSRNSSMKTSLLVDKNHCSAFRCAYTVYWISSVHYTKVVAVNFNLYERIHACGSHGVSKCYFYWVIIKMLC